MTNKTKNILWYIWFMLWIILGIISLLGWSYKAYSMLNKPDVISTTIIGSDGVVSVNTTDDNCYVIKIDELKNDLGLSYINVYCK